MTGVGSPNTASGLSEDLHGVIVEERDPVELVESRFVDAVLWWKDM